MSVTVHEIIRRFETWAINHLAKGTVLNYRRHLARFAVHVGDVPSSTLKAHHLLEWGKRWHEIQAVQRCWNWAANEAELIERSPFARVKKPKAGKRKRIFERRDLFLLLRRARQDFRLFLLALRETIARPQEIRAVRWDEIRPLDPALSFEESLRAGKSYFQLEEYKHRHLRTNGDDARLIPISPRLGRMLWRMHRSASDQRGEIFRTFRGRPWTKEAVRLRMKRLRKALGLGADRRGENLVAYTIRHTMATSAAAGGLRDRLLADLMGHTTTRTTARYQHLHAGHLIEAMKRIKLTP